MAGEWGGPVRPEGDPSGWGGELDFKREVRTRLAALETRNPLQNASIGAGGLTFRGDGAAKSDDFETGVSGWRVGGDSAEFNDITLRGGIIGNDALTNPVQAGYASSSQTAFSTSTTEQDMAVGEITVPPGFTQALVMCTASVGALNPTANLDFLYVKAMIASVGSNELPVAVSGSNGWGAVTTAKASLLSGLTPGGTVSVAARVHTQSADWAANSSNRAWAEAIAIFLR